MDKDERIQQIINGERHPADKYREEFALELIIHMRNGKSFTSFQALLYDKYNVRITKKTLYNWRDRHPEFAESMEIGKAVALNFFENLLISASTGTMPEILEKKNSKGINLSGVIFALKTRFFREYGENVKLQGNEEAPPIKHSHKIDLDTFQTADLETMLEIVKRNQSGE